MTWVLWLMKRQPEKKSYTSHPGPEAQWTRPLELDSQWGRTSDTSQVRVHHAGLSHCVWAPSTHSIVEDPCLGAVTAVGTFQLNPATAGASPQVSNVLRTFHLTSCLSVSHSLSASWPATMTDGLGPHPPFPFAQSWQRFSVPHFLWDHGLEHAVNATEITEINVAVNEQMFWLDCRINSRHSQC